MPTNDTNIEKLRAVLSDLADIIRAHNNTSTSIAGEDILDALENCKFIRYEFDTDENNNITVTPHIEQYDTNTPQSQDTEDYFRNILKRASKVTSDTNKTFTEISHIVADSQGVPNTNYTANIPATSSTGEAPTIIKGGDLSANADIVSIIIPEGFTTIDDNAFNHCTSLTNITIPESITSVGEGAFSNCPALVYNEVNNVKYLGNSSTPYLVAVKAVNTNIATCTIDNNCKSIYDSAFYNCRNISGSIIIPNSVTSIGNDAFKICNNASDITLSDNLVSIGDRAFQSCEYIYGTTSASGNLLLPNTLISIGEYAFRFCYRLRALTIGDNLKTIGALAFSHCRSLEDITVSANNSYFDSRDNCKAIIRTSDNTLIVGCKNTIIPSTVPSIGDNAFIGCRYLPTNFTIPNTVTSIGRSAFNSCDSFLRTITIPDSVTSIGANAFEGCVNLATITLSNNLTYIENGLLQDCTSLTSITIPNNVTSIGSNAFKNCRQLTNITIPDNVTSIGDFAFNYCASLTSAVIGDSVTSIGEGAFSNCTSLTSVIIPDSVTSIGNSVFSDCTSLYNVTLSENLVSIGDSAFYRTAIHNINIPKSVISIGGYAFGWNNTDFSSANIYYNGSVDNVLSDTTYLTNVVYQFYFANPDMTLEFIDDFGGTLSTTPKEIFEGGGSGSGSGSGSGDGSEFDPIIVSIFYLDNSTEISYSDSLSYETKYYQLDIIEDGDYYMYLSSNEYSCGTLYDADGYEVTYDSGSHPDSDDFCINYYLYSGNTYYLAVKEVNDGAIDSYTLYIDTTGPSSQEE